MIIEKSTKYGILLYLNLGVLEANFVEPAHDKQGFEKTNVLARLETRLLQMQKTYWYGCKNILFKFIVTRLLTTFLLIQVKLLPSDWLLQF
mgnify:CR=1 FL=1